MLKIAVIEDSKEFSETLKSFFTKFSSCGESLDVVYFESAIPFLEHYKPIYDIVFMDIMLPHMNGMDAAHKLRELDQSVVLIFVTNMAQLAVKGYEVNAADYIVKPLLYHDFALKFRRAVLRCKEAASTVLITQQSETRRVLLREVIYIEVHGHTLSFKMETGSFSSTGTISEMESNLKNKGFLRCNKCFLINQRHIALVRSNTVIMSNGDELQISRPRKKQFMHDLTESIGKENSL